MAPPTITGVFDTACIVDFDGERESPRPLYRHNQTCSPNVEGILEHREGDFRFYLDVLAGENAGYTQPVGLQGGPIDPVQLYAELHLGHDFYVMAGRAVTGMHREVVRADQNEYILRDPTFGRVPTTETGVGVALRTDEFSLTARGMPRPDGITENNGTPTLAGTGFIRPFKGVSLTGNGQVGALQDNNSNRLRKTADLLLTIEPEPAFSAGLYGLYRTEEVEGGRQTTRGAVLYLGFQVSDSLRAVVRAGAVHDEGEGIEEQRTFGFTAGVNYGWEIEGVKGQLRLQLTNEEVTTGRGADEAKKSSVQVAAQIVTVLE